MSNVDKFPGKSLLIPKVEVVPSSTFGVTSSNGEVSDILTLGGGKLNRDPIEEHNGEWVMVNSIGMQLKMRRACNYTIMGKKVVWDSLKAYKLCALSDFGIICIEQKADSDVVYSEHSSEHIKCKIVDNDIHVELGEV